MRPDHETRPPEDELSRRRAEEPIADVIARVRAPYTYAYGDSGDAASDALRLADAYEELVHRGAAE